MDNEHLDRIERKINWTFSAILIIALWGATGLIFNYYDTHPDTRGGSLMEYGGIIALWIYAGFIAKKFDNL